MAMTNAEQPALAAIGAGPSPAATTPDHALELLREGNARFVAGTSACGPLTARRLELTQGQSPFAIVLGCSDSRVPIETVFDQNPGHIFAVRLAGNFVDENGLGSIEYGVAVLKAPLIVVLGHGSCGAVGATVAFVEEGTSQPGHIQGLVKAIEPAATATKGQPGDWLSNAIAENVKLN
ncbi:MAG: carbonic anhydrase, partial [Candidatus Eremiobacteraeota bacterium]|nr:carbonic anhydrase [Candidatus Eremiobacteraeota bacterium]